MPVILRELDHIGLSALQDTLRPYSEALYTVIPRSDAGQSFTSCPWVVWPARVPKRCTLWPGPAGLHERCHYWQRPSMIRSAYPSRVHELRSRVSLTVRMRDLLNTNIGPAQRLRAVMRANTNVNFPDRRLTRRPVPTRFA